MGSDRRQKMEIKPFDDANEYYYPPACFEEEEWLLKNPVGLYVD